MFCPFRSEGQTINEENKKMLHEFTYKKAEHLIRPFPLAYSLEVMLLPIPFCFVFSFFGGVGGAVVFAVKSFSHYRWTYIFACTTVCMFIWVCVIAYWIVSICCILYTCDLYIKYANYLLNILNTELLCFVRHTCNTYMYTSCLMHVRWYNFRKKIFVIS